MTRTGTLILTVVFSMGALAATSGCGSSDRPPGGAVGSAGTSGAAGSGGTMSSGSGVDGTKMIPTLTDAEKGQVCDWMASLVGGYGMSNTCGMGSFTPPMSKSDCVMFFSSCNVKVSDFEGCTKAEADAEKACTDAAFGTAVATPACMAVLSTC
jgi:hypothetical protein